MNKKIIQLGPKQVEIPSEWRISPIGEMNECKLKSSGIEKFDGTKKYLSTSSIERSKIKEVEEQIEYDDRPSRANMQPELNTVWFAKMQDTIKVYAFTNRNKEEIDKYILSTGFSGLKYKEGIDVNFIKQFLLSGLFNQVKNSLAHGSTQKAVNDKDIRSFKIPLPSLTEQKKIAEVLGAVDETIDKTDQIIEKSKELKKGLMQDLLTKGIGHEEFKEVQLGPRKIKIPVHWNSIVIGNVASLQSGNGFKSKDFKEEGIPLIKISNIQNGKVSTIEDQDYLPASYQNDYSNFLLDKDDLLIALSGATTGKMGFVDKDILPAFLNQRVGRLTINDSKVNKKFMGYYLTQKKIKDYIFVNAQASAQQNISPKFVEGLKAYLPSLSEQKEIANILSRVDKKTKKEKEYKEKLQELKKGLMQDLLTGKVRVTNLIE